MKRGEGEESGLGPNQASTRRNREAKGDGAGTAGRTVTMGEGPDSTPKVEMASSDVEAAGPRVDRAPVLEDLGQHPPPVVGEGEAHQRGDGEVDGRDYRFLSKENFEQLIADGALLEYAEVHGCYYGTLRSSIEDAIDVGLDIVLEIDVEGARQLRESDLPQVSFFVNPPSLEILAQRLRDRGTETEDQMARRLSIVEREMACADLYDHVVVNDDLERMIAEVGEILGIQIPPTPEIEAKA